MSAEGPRWYESDWTVFIGFVFAGPLILPLVWRNPRYGPVKKAVLTVVFVGLTVFFVLVLAEAGRRLLSHYERVLTGAA